MFRFQPIRRALLAGALSLICPIGAAAQQSPAAGILTSSIGQGSREHPALAPPRVAAPPRLDGRLDDAVWRSAARITRFVQERPVEAAPPSEQTEVLVAYDSQRIYFGVYVHYADLAVMRANRADRDQATRDDVISFYFDPFLDQQRAYVFSVNAYGVQGDGLISGSGGGGGGNNNTRRGPNGADLSWDALFYSAGAMVEDGWTAEVAIPFKSLRYPAHKDGTPHRWGFQVQREIQSRNESIVWAPVSRDVLGFLTQMGTLEGMNQLSMSRNLELLPTVTAVANQSLDTDTGVRGASDVEEAGMSVKYGLTSNLTLDFTFNPDFSQIESDRAQVAVNQRFPLFFPELRPFFLEGQEIFSIPGPVTLVHTRTIVNPRYGAKVTGKVGKTTVGFLVADDEAPGLTDSVTDPAYGRSATNVLGRVRYDLYSESSVGLVATSRTFMDQFSRVGGFDSMFKIGRNQRFQFRAIGTSHRGSEGVETSGRMIDANFRKESRGLAYSTTYYEITPEFKTDAGFVRRTNERQGSANLSYRWWPQNWVVNWGPRINYNRNYEFSGKVQDTGVGLGWNAQFARNINVNVNTDRDMERYNALDFHKVRYGVGFGINTSRRISVSGFTNWGDQIRYVTNPYLGKGRNGQLTVTLRPFSRLQSELLLTTSSFTDVRTNTQEFAIKIYRLLTTYQFTDRLLLRNITDYNDYDRTLGGNLLLTYRVNAGTALFVGYDDRYRSANQVNAVLYPGDEDYTRTSRAIFAKLQVLFRY
ncbi:MAG: DUF5916 domain-containing protein [Vicinamibacterales bacterium]